MPLRLVRWLVAGAVVAVVGVIALVSAPGHDPARWHLDPAIAAPGAKPNEYRAAPPGATRFPADAETRVYAEAPRDLLARFHAMALKQPRTRAIAGSRDEMMITYVQRSRLFRFPDYITVKVVPVDGGAGLIIWSRSRYGTSDFGVNRARVEAWLAALEQGG